MGNLPDGGAVDGKEGVIAVGDVIGAVIPYVFRQVDHAEAAVHPAVLLPIADPEPVPLLLQNAEGRPAGDGAQAGSLAGVFLERQALNGPNRAVQGGDRGPEGDLLRLELRSVPVHGGNAEAVPGAGAQPSCVIAQMLLRREAGGGLPRLPSPALHLKVMALDALPLQSAQPGAGLPVCKGQLSPAGQRLSPGLRRRRGGAAEDEAPLFPARPDGKPLRAQIPFLQGDGHLPLPGPACKDAERLIVSEHLVDVPLSRPAEGGRAVLQGPGDLRGLQVFGQGQPRVEALPAFDLFGFAEDACPVGHGPDPDFQLLPRQDVGNAEGGFGGNARRLLRAAGKLHPVQSRGAGGLGPIELHAPVPIDADQQVSLLKDGPPAAQEEEDPRRQQRQPGDNPSRPGPDQPPGLDPGPPAPPAPISPLIPIPSRDPHPASYK